MSKIRPDAVLLHICGTVSSVDIQCHPLFSLTLQTDLASVLIHLLSSAVSLSLSLSLHSFIQYLVSCFVLSGTLFCRAVSISAALFGAANHAEWKADGLWVGLLDARAEAIAEAVGGEFITDVS